VARTVAAPAIAVSAGTSRASSAVVRGFRVSDLTFTGDLRLEGHAHERSCLAVLLEGGVDKAFGGRRLVVASGGAVTMPAHAWHVDRFSPAGARILVIEPDSGSEVLAPCARLVRDVHLVGAGLGSQAWRLAGELAAHDQVSHLAIEAGALELYAGAARIARPVNGTRRPPAWLREVEERLRDIPPGQVTIAGLARDVGVHPIHLARVFRRYHGAAPAAYVRRLRLDWAARELIRSDTPLSVVASEAGFADQAHFTRAFKAATGLTPGRYRQAAGW
jgi:AraC family transcriptional regulator